MQLQFGVQSYQHRSLPVSAQRMVNCYLETPPAEGKSAPVVQSYGVREWTTVGEGPIRGGLVVNNVPYIVSGNQLFRLQSSGASTSLGSVPGFSPVDMTSDGTNVLVVASPVGYLWNGFTLAPIADTDFPGASVCEYLDGYAVVIEPGSARAWITESNLGDWSQWNALDFTVAEGWPDDVVGAIVDHRELFLFGRETTEVFWNSGAADFPLERVASGFIEKGLLSTHGPAKHDNTIFFPGNDGVVYRLDGFTPVRISTHAIEQAIESYTDKTCRGITWTEAGHAFYALSFADDTWVYDISTGLWHERQSYGLPHWRVHSVLRVFDRWLALDGTSSKVGELTEGAFAEWGDVLRCSATSPTVSADNRWVFHGRLELVFEQGVGVLTGQGEDPQVMLDWSDDDGRHWSNEKWRNLGRMGEYRKRTCWNRMGRAKNRVYRYAITDPVRRTLVQAMLDAEPGGY